MENRITEGIPARKKKNGTTHVVHTIVPSMIETSCSRLLPRRVVSSGSEAVGESIQAHKRHTEKREVERAMDHGQSRGQRPTRAMQH